MYPSHLHKLPTIRNWLDQAGRELRDVGIESALLDAEIILAHTLKQSRTWLHAHDDHVIEPRQVEIADARLQLRLDRTPIAYIIGHKEFYGRRFTVTPSVLVPRPESEEIITTAKRHLPESAKTLVDVGTGSGCLAITLKLELPQLSVAATDIEQHALNVAKRNAGLLHANVTFIKSDLLRAIYDPVDCIVANLPYVDPEWDSSPELVHEPAGALYASNDGLSLIEELIPQARSLLLPGGLLILEAAIVQHAAIIEFAKARDFKHLDTIGLIVAFERV